MVNNLPQSVVSVKTVENEIEDRWNPKKYESTKLSNRFFELGYTSRAIRVSTCGDFLQFAYSVSEDGSVSDTGKLHNANFCRDRLCPMCNWRRSLKLYSNLSDILTSDKIYGKYKFLMITLTIPNVVYSDLSSAIYLLVNSWQRMSRKGIYKKLIRGYYRTLETTVNLRTETFHPHMHILVAVPLTYGKKDMSYISHDMLLQDWRKETGIDSITQVDIRLIKPKNKAVESFSDALNEVTKYCVKVADYDKLSDSALIGLIDGLKGRRLVSLGGVFKSVSTLLNQQDVESSEVDLIHLNNDIDPITMYLIRTYKWTMNGYVFDNENISEVANV